MSTLHDKEMYLFYSPEHSVSYCNSTNVIDGDDGTLSIVGNLSVTGEMSCVWTLTGNGTKPALSLYLNGKEPVHLHPNDTLEILDEKNFTSVNLTGDDLKRWGVILSNVTKAGMIRLNISADPGSRQFHAGFDRVSSGAVFHFNQPHDYFLPINHIGDSAQNGVLSSYSVTFIPNPTSDPDKLLLVNYRQILGSPVVSVEGSSAAKDEKTPSFDLLNDEKDKKGVKISLSNFDYSNTRLVLGTELVDSSCSYYKRLDSKEAENVITGPANPVLGSSLNCVWLFRSDVPLRIDSGETRFLYGDDDIVEVVDGPRLLNNRILCELNKENLDQTEHSFDHSVSKGTQLRVSLVSKYVTNPTGLYKMRVSRATRSKINPTGQFDLSGDDEPDPVFLFSGKRGQKAVFVAAENCLAGCNLSFFASDERNESPFMTVYKGDVMPMRVVSPSSQLRISVSEKTQSGVKGSFSSESTLDSTAVGDSSSFLVPGVRNETTVSWLLPGRPGSGSGSLQLTIHRLVLESEKNCLELEKMAEKRMSIFKACFNPKQSPIATRALPQILLNSTFSHLLTYSTGPFPANESSLLEASVTYNDGGCSFFNRTLGGSESVIFAPESYPNNFRLNEESVDGKCHSWYFGRPEALLHVVFDDLQLLGDQKLTVRGPGVEVVLDKDSVSDSIPDLVVVNSTFFQMNSPLNPTYSDLSDISGRGFRVNISSTTCGGRVDGDKSSNLTTSGYPAALSGVSKCVWMINSTATNAIINITRSFGKDGGDGDLVIFDSPSSRVNRFNESYVRNGTFTTSVSSTLIIYTPKDPTKPVKGLMLNWTVDCMFFYYS